MSRRRSRIEEVEDAPTFAPQWADRRLEEEMDGLLSQLECRLCACTEDSACEGGCEWTYDAHGCTDMCSVCEEVMRGYPLLRIADGFGLGHWLAFAPKDARELGRPLQVTEDPPLWICVCGNIVESNFCCPRCSNEPPWGCDCPLHDDGPEDDGPYFDHFEEFESEHNPL